MPMMDYSKMKKPGPMISKKYGMLPKHYSISTWTGATLELYNRTKFKDGKGYDDTNLLGTVDFGKMDAYGCMPIRIHMNTHLAAEDYAEILTVLTQAVQGIDKAKMVQINKEDDALVEAMKQKKFREDDRDSNCMLWTEKQQNWIALYMCLGIAVGLFAGIYISFINTTVGLILGVILGGALGYWHTRKDRKKFEERLQERSNAPEPVPEPEPAEDEDSDAVEETESAGEADPTEE